MATPVIQLAKARKAQDLSQEDLARLAGVTVKTIWRIEAGEYNPRAGTLHAIARALGVSLDVLLPAEEVPA